VRLAHPQVPHDVLAHHDGVVDQRPMARLSASSVMMLSVKPSA
jgi:hypothetical protein